MTMRKNSYRTSHRDLYRTSHRDLIPKQRQKQKHTRKHNLKAAALTRALYIHILSPLAHLLTLGPTTERELMPSQSQTKKKRHLALRPQPEGLETLYDEATLSLRVNPWEGWDQTLGEGNEDDDHM